MMFCKHFLLIACVSVINVTFIVQPVLAAKIYLKNGDVISGTSLPSNIPYHLKIQTHFNQVIFVPERNIKRIDSTTFVKSTQNESVKKTKEQLITNALSEERQKSFKDKNAAIKSAIAEQNKKQATLAANKKIKTENKEHPNKDKTWLGAVWKGRANIGGSIQTGNAEQTALNADASTDAKWGKKHRTRMRLQINREKDNGRITVDNKNFESAYDFFYSPKWFSSSSVGLETDEIEQIKLRTDVGTGVGYQPYKSNDLNLKMILSGVYFRQENELRETDNSIATKWFSDYDQKIWDGLFQLFHDHEILVPTKDSSDFLVATNTGLRIPLSKGLVATTEVQFDWDNLPEQGNVEEDVTYAFKVGYEW